MASNKKNLVKKTTAKYLLAAALTIGVAGATSNTAFAQTPPTPPPGAPTPPPPPGELFNKLFKKKKDKPADNKTADTKKDAAPAQTEVAPATPPAGPPPPPNPLNLFKKKKKAPDPAPTTDGPK